MEGYGERKMNITREVLTEFINAHVDTTEDLESASIMIWNRDGVKVSMEWEDYKNGLVVGNQEEDEEQ